MIGQQAHLAAVQRVRDQLAALPQDQPVRLAKKTSNLFRSRERISSPGLDVADLNHVISIDPQQQTADVQGMTTYEELVAETLPFGLMPYVVPQLRTITLGGAVTGLGIESSSFRLGLPHESVIELDILTGAGEILHVTPDGDHADLFRAFPNSYGSLGYSVRLRIKLMPVKPFVRLQHVRFDDLESCIGAMDQIVRTGEHENRAVDFLDGVVFSQHEAYLVVGTFADHAPYVSDYTGQQIYYRSIQQRTEDYLTVKDYIWRWDTDWFWCDGALGLGRPMVRRLWPDRYKRSDVYSKIIRFETTHEVKARIDKWRGKPARERVIQDVEVPIARTAEFLRWFTTHVPITPVWLCPMRLADHTVTGQPWPLYPMRTGETYVNVGFWATVPIVDGAQDGDVNRQIEQAVEEFDGHKSLYSDAYYDRDTFWQLYGGETYQAIKKRYDPSGRLPDLYTKAVLRK